MYEPNFTDIIGVPFVDGGRNIKTGFDCWGLSLEVFKRYGFNLPDYKIGCFEFELIDERIEAQKDCWICCDSSAPPVPSLVVMRWGAGLMCNHTGVYIGAGRFIHTRQKIGVNIDLIDSPAWRKIIEGYYIPKPEVLGL